MFRAVTETAPLLTLHFYSPALRAPGPVWSFAPCAPSLSLLCMLWSCLVDVIISMPQLEDGSKDLVNRAQIYICTAPAPAYGPETSSFLCPDGFLASSGKF